MRIEPANAADLDAIERLLTEQHLPLDGLREHVELLLVARDAKEIVASAGLELYGAAALLRSVAVSPALRRQGLGASMTAAVLERAAERGVREVFLLTTTAEAFFGRHGFERVSRSEVPADVQQSIEFTAACPASATVMRRVLSRTSA